MTEVGGAGLGEGSECFTGTECQGRWPVLETGVVSMPLSYACSGGQHGRLVLCLLHHGQKKSR